MHMGIQYALESAVLSPETSVSWRKILKCAAIAFYTVWPFYFCIAPLSQVSNTWAKVMLYCSPLNPCLARRSSVAIASFWGVSYMIFCFAATQACQVGARRALHRPGSVRVLLHCFFPFLSSYPYIFISLMVPGRAALISEAMITRMPTASRAKQYPAD